MNIEGTVAKIEDKITSIEKKIDLIMENLKIEQPKKPPRAGYIGIHGIPQNK